MPQPVDIMAAAFEDELVKIASAKVQGKGLGRKLAPVAAGIVGYETLRRAEHDRRLGRQIRKQQQGGGY